ncbi:MAG: GNAT family N-acetyltransferase [Deltaproteobacteria bacterium]|jgi:GNAT superfamily N-acetyltransferase|nr:GNAT family N-acetyltransferase [Deltaproteobacteria bacterium]
MTAEQRKAEARILAATLTLLAREEESLPSPYALWRTPLTPADIKDLALKVASGQARVVWVDEAYPARGLLIVQDQALESIILGQSSHRLLGPWLFELDPLERQKKTAALAQKAKDLEPGPGFLAVKAIHDPAIIRGFGQAGFVVAEISSVLSGPINPKLFPEFAFTRGEGLTLRTPLTGEGEKWLEALGELFYDGHYLHGPFLPHDFSAKLWRAVALNHFSRGLPALFLWEELGQRPVAVSLASVKGQEASLTALFVAEDRRGEGLGELLMLETLRELWRQDCQTLAVETASYNLPALALYQGLGLATRAPLITLHCLKS